MTDGPFYPSVAYRARALDWDADLTTVRGSAPDGQPLPRARGEHLDLHGAVVDGDGRAVDGAEIEIWQCDAFGSYRHPRGAGDRIDAGFQGFGSDAQRRARRLPLPHDPAGAVSGPHAAHPRQAAPPTFGEVTSQLFVAGEPGNPGDFLYRSLGEGDRQDVEMRLQRAPAGERGDVDRRARPASSARSSRAPRLAARSVGVVGAARVAGEALALPVDVVAAEAVEVGAVEDAREDEQQVAQPVQVLARLARTVVAAPPARPRARSARRATVRPTWASAALRVPAGRMNSFSRGSAAL